MSPMDVPNLKNPSTAVFLDYRDGIARGSTLIEHIISAPP